MYICIFAQWFCKISQALPLIGLDVFFPTHYLILSLLVLAPIILFTLPIILSYVKYKTEKFNTDTDTELVSQESGEITWAMQIVNLVPDPMCILQCTCSVGWDEWIWEKGILMVGTVNLECRASALRGKNLHSLKKPWQQGKTVREEKNPAENTPVQKLIQQRNEHKSPVRQLPPLAPVTGLTFTVLCTVERFPYSIMEGQVHICIFHIRLLKCRCS